MLFLDCAHSLEEKATCGKLVLDGFCIDVFVDDGGTIGKAAGACHIGIARFVGSGLDILEKVADRFFGCVGNREETTFDGVRTFNIFALVADSESGSRFATCCS